MLNNLHVLADFDGTMTKIHNSRGEMVSAMIAVLRMKNLLWEEHAQAANALFEHYRPIEHDPVLSVHEKATMMERWRHQAADLLVQHQFNRSHIDQIIDSWMVELRSWRQDFFALLQHHRIPLTIYSASGMWVECIEAYLAKHNVFDTSLIKVVWNRFKRNTHGYATALATRVMHTYNKASFHLNDFDWFHTQLYQWRNHAIVLGNSLWDSDIWKTHPFHSVESYWYLNDKQPSQEHLNAFQNTFDHVLTRDQWFEPIITKLQQL